MSTWSRGNSQARMSLAAENVSSAGIQGEVLPPAQLDVERQALAKRYARERQWLSLINLGISSVLILILLFSGLGFYLRDALAPHADWQPIAGWRPLLVGLYFLVLYAAAFVLGL